MIKNQSQRKENVRESKTENNRNNVIIALEKLGYKVTLGFNKDISDPNYSGIIGRRKRG